MYTDYTVDLTWQEGVDHIHFAIFDPNMCQSRVVCYEELSAITYIAGGLFRFIEN